MSYINIEDFKFNNTKLRGFSIISIDNINCNITDIEVVLQKNRAIVLNIIINNTSLIKYLNTEAISIIRGKYYHYSFIATIDHIKNTGFHSPFFNYNIVVDSIEFSKSNNFFLTSNKKWGIEIIPTENFLQYLERRKSRNILKFNNVSLNSYNNRYRLLLDLYSIIHNTPILIEKIYLTNNTQYNSLF